MKKLFLLICSFLAVNAFAQTNKSNRIHVNIQRDIQPAILQWIDGSIAFIDPSGNNIIDADEECSIRFSVKNAGMEDALNCMEKAKGSFSAEEMQKVAEENGKLVMNYSDFEAGDLKEAGLMDYYAYVVTDGVYISDDKGGHTRYKDEYEGAVRYKYRIMPMDGELEYTFVGVQKNGALVRDDSLGLIASTEGILSFDDVLAKNESNSAAGNIFAFVAAALFIGGGIVCIVVKKKEEN